MTKLSKNLAAGLLIAGFLAAPLTLTASETATKTESVKKTQKVKPYPLTTCVVSGEKLGGDMGAPYVFTYKGQEIKLCCKDCKKDFDKSPSKFMKKIVAAEKKGKPHQDTPAK